MIYCSNFSRWSNILNMLLTFPLIYCKLRRRLVKKFYKQVLINKVFNFSSSSSRGVLLSGEFERKISEASFNAKGVLKIFFEIILRYVKENNCQELILFEIYARRKLFSTNPNHQIVILPL